MHIPLPRLWLGDRQLENTQAPHPNGCQQNIYRANNSLCFSGRQLVHFNERMYCCAVINRKPWFTIDVDTSDVNN